MPAYPTTLPASDVYSWAKQPCKLSYASDEIGNLPDSGVRHLRGIYTGGGGYQSPAYFSGKGLAVNMMNVPYSYCDVLYINGYNSDNGSGFDVPVCNALAFSKSGSGEILHATFHHDATDYGTWYKLIDERGGTLTGSLTAPSFIKNNSSDSYVLLGGGGHKAESSLSVSNSNYSNCLNIVGYGVDTLSYFQGSTSFAGYPADWASYMICNHGNGSNYYNQTIIMPFWSSPKYSRLKLVY